LAAESARFSAVWKNRSATMAPPRIETAMKLIVITFARGVEGTMSPKPTVVITATEKYIASTKAIFCSYMKKDTMQPTNTVVIRAQRHT